VRCTLAHTLAHSQSPSTHMMLAAMIALWSLPRVNSHRLSRSRITVTRNLFSRSSVIEPEIDPMAQHRLLSVLQLYSLPDSCSASFSSIWLCVSAWSKCERYTSVSRICLYCARTSESARCRAPLAHE
jgi:hypothetical protein